MTSHVSRYAAADAVTAYAYFRAKLGFETDCQDVHDSQQDGSVDFVLVDARGPNAFAAAHVPGAINIPHREMNAERMAAFAADTLFVVYCAGPHCNGANQAAMKLAQLGFAVKEMIGGITGWLDDGFTLTESRLNTGEKIACEC